MSELRRLRDENPTGLERELLAAGTSYRSSNASRQKTLAALGLVTSAAASTSIAAAASSSALQKIGLTKLLTISGIGVVIATPVGFYAWKTLRAPAPEQALMAPVVAVPEAPRVAAPSPATEPPKAPEAAPTADVPAPKADARPTASGALSAELGVLDVARSKLASGDPRGALGVLDEYSRTYPRGRLGMEAEVLRIDALAKAGDRQAAKKRAEAFLKRHPKSLLASRVRGYLDEPR